MNQKALVLLFPLLALAGCAPEPAATNGAADAPAAAPASASTAPEPTPAAPVADIETRLAAADPAMGQRQYIVCQACHGVEAGGAHKVGPNLHGIFGKGAGQAEGFMYSTVLRESGITWDAAAMDEWLASPSAMVPGTIMVFAGINDPAQRANLIAYLQQVTSAP